MKFALQACVRHLMSKRVEGTSKEYVGYCDIQQRWTLYKTKDYEGNLLMGELGKYRSKINTSWIPGSIECYNPCNSLVSL